MDLSGTGRGETDSFARFVAAFIGDGKLTKEEADELRKLL